MWIAFCTPCADKSLHIYQVFVLVTMNCLRNHKRLLAIASEQQDTTKGRTSALSGLQGELGSAYRMLPQEICWLQRSSEGQG
jgi:hypothetical protein